MVIPQFRGLHGRRHRVHSWWKVKTSTDIWQKKTSRKYCPLTITPFSIKNNSVRPRHSTATDTTSNIFGDRCFASAGSRLWKSLPINLRQCHSLEQFWRLLKTFLFSAWSHGALWHLPKSAPYINLLTYLLTYHFWFWKCRSRMRKSLSRQLLLFGGGCCINHIVL